MTAGPTRRELLRSAGVAAAAAVTAGLVPGVRADAHAWPAFGREAANTGHNPGVTGPRTDVGAAWRFDTGGHVTSSPAVVDGTVYVGSRDDGVYAVDAASGEEVWRFGTEGDVASSPAVTDGTVYVGSSDGRMYAVDAASGEEVWRFGTGGAVTSAPTVVDVSAGDDGSAGAVYVGSRDGTVYAIDAAAGTEAWRFETEFAIESSPAVATVGFEDGEAPTVFVGSDDQRLYALDAETGEQRWAFGEATDVIRSPPAVAGGVVYVGSVDTNVYAVDAASGEELWRFGTGGAVTASPAVVDGDGGPAETVYVGSRSTDVYAVDAASGEELWQFGTGQPVTASPAVADGAVYVGSADFHVYGIDATDGEELWRFEVGDRVRSSPAVVDAVPAGGSGDGAVYVGSRDGSVYALAEGADTAGPSTPGESTDGSVADTGEPGAGPYDTLGRFSFLVWPVLFLSVLATIIGGYFGALRAGLIGSDDTRTGVDARGRRFGQIDDDASTTAADVADDEGGIPVWDIVLEDVIDRAPETSRTAREDLLVTKYVDARTLDVPVVAYEIESYRDEPTAVRVTESLDAGDGDSSPHGLEGWHAEDGRLVFETAVEPEGSVRTLVARRDVAPEHAEELLDRPEVAIEE